MKQFLLLIIYCMIFSNIHAQGCPDNIDFEKGDFSVWQCSIGTTYIENGKNVIDLKPTAPKVDHHTLISADLNGYIPLDEYGNFPKVCPYGGSKYSVKLGNNNTGAEAEGLSYTFTVPPQEDTFSFTYYYAVVFEDPDHTKKEQPRFFVTAYETNTGTVINCASYDYVSTGGLPGFLQSANGSQVLYKKWSPASIQFVGLANKSITLEFKTADCTLGGHFGYAYLDVGSGCSNILATAPYCKETNSLLLNAPYGFQYYTWYNEDYTQVLGHAQDLTLSPPPDTTGKFYVDMDPYPGYGCRDTGYAVVTPLPVPDTPVAQTDYFYCQNQSSGKLSAIAALNSDLLWYTDTTKPGSLIAPSPSTAQAGVFLYYVSQKVLFGCESFKKKIIVTVNPVPVVSFIINKAKQCQDSNNFMFTSTSSNLQEATFYWDFGDGNAQASTADSVVNYSYNGYGNFTVNLKITNGPVCFKEVSKVITIVPAPLADFNYPSVICENETQVMLHDQSSVTQSLSTITKWQWKIGSINDNAKDPAPFTANTPGDLPVSLTVSTNEGCMSDTVKTLKIHYQPKPSFIYDAPLCNNKLIHFTDKSILSPDAAGENINTWLWQIDNFTATNQNPTFNLAAGIQHATLAVKTNFGCSNIPADSLIEVFPKPTIAVNINDSCVNRRIDYTAMDISGNVNNWYWDFGKGAKSDKSVVSNYYYTEGNKPFTLYAKTQHGCFDTLRRSFAIYDNKAFAGNDTLAAFNQPVQLMANGGPDNNYVWTPSLGLNDAHIENPIAILNTDILYKLDALTDKGCDSHSDIFIKRYKGPDIYIPTAFTPNNDQLNDILKAIPVGMKSLGYFAVYNQYGNRVFYTTDFSKGWDGLYKNIMAGSGTYAAVAQAVDYSGQNFIKKVSVVLIR